MKLPAFGEIVANTTLLVDLLTQNGIQDIESIEMKKRMGGTQPNNLKAQITFHNQTSYQIVVKGSRDDMVARDGFREALFYSRIAPTLPAEVHTANILFAAVDPEHNQ
jgi:hypothetical protein